VTRSVILCDGHELVRFGMRALLRSAPEYRIVAEAGDGISALAVIEQHKPDVVILDISLPGLSGLDVTRETCRVSPRTRIMIVSMHTADIYVAQAFHNGASGYVRKDAPSAEVLDALREVAAGGRYLDSTLSDTVLGFFNDGRTEAELDPQHSLSMRERQVLHLTAEGLSAQAIADRLCISPRTVESHRANIMRKLGLKTHTDLVLFAVRHGIVSVL
jgi:DNA-binding NarL/FixJ family response regulator